MSCAEGVRRKKPVSRGSPEGLLLLAVLLLAAALRFTGLAWGLRHPPHSDERVFVESVLQMIEQGDLDHRYYEYPGLFFYVLYPVLRVLSLEEASPSTVYLAARAVVAAFGVLGCALLYALGKEMAGREAGLLGSLLLAVSPVAVQTAHMVRPDVVLQAFVLLALLAIRRVGRGARGDIGAGAALGLAGATKFSAAFLLPSFLAQRLLSPGRRLRGLALAGIVALLVFFLATPYAVLHVQGFLAGVETQLHYHYEEPVRSPASYPEMVRGYLEVSAKTLGLPGAILSLLGLAAAARAWRTWLPPLLLPVTAIAVLSTSDVRFDRLLLPALSVAFVLAGAGAALLTRRRLALCALAAVAAAFPLASSFEYIRAITGPLTRDRVLDWAQANVLPGARVLSAVSLLGLDAARWEVLDVARLDPESRPQVLEADFVVTTPWDSAEALSGLRRLYAAEPEMRPRGTTITVWAVPEALRPPYQPVTLEPRWLSASENPQDLPAACDGRPETWWRTKDPQEPGDWVQVSLPEPVLLARIELRLGDSPKFAAKELQVLVSEDGHRFREAPALPGRPRVEDQVAPGREPSQVLLLAPPARARAVRLTQTGLGARRRWGIAEISLEALPDLPEG